MWSFEGEHRRRPNVSLSGASRLMDKAAFLEKLRKERESRENNKKREVAAVRLQSFIRGWLCRVHTNQLYRQRYDDGLQAAPSPLTEQVARVLCLRMLRMFRIKHDAHRLSMLCTLLVRHGPSLLQWVVETPSVWLTLLSRLLSLSLETICNCKESVNHAGPLRLLEVLTQPQSWASLPSITPSRQAHFVFSFVMPLIDRGYFKFLIKLLTLKVPEMDERGGVSSSPLATSILDLIFYPLFLVATCRRSSEQFNPDSLLLVPNLPWVKMLKSQPTLTTLPHSTTSVLGESVTAIPECVTSNIPETRSKDTSVATLSQDGAVAHTTMDTRGPITSTKDVMEDDNMDLDSYDDGPIKPAKLPRDDLDSHHSKTVDGIDCSSQLLCYAFSGVPVECPSNFINLTLYNLVDQLFSASQHSQVHNLLAPRIEQTKLLLCHPSASHSLIQAIHHVLLHSQTSSADTPTDAPTQLMVLLTLLPIKTVLPTPSLQLYLLSCRRLVRRTAHFLPLRKQTCPPPSSSDRLLEVPAEEDSETEEDSDEDDDDSPGRQSREKKLVETPSAHLIEVGEWCLAHINSPEYVSWVLDEVEAANLDRDVLTEFCSLTHTLLTAPCLSLFQCRLLYGVAGRHKIQRAMWELLTSLYPSWVSAPSMAHEKSSRGCRPLLDTVSRGAPLDPVDRDTLVPVLASFSTALLAVLATLHDSELVTSPEDAFESILSRSETYTPSACSDGSSNKTSSFAFSVRELVTISGTLRDVCVGLAELAHPDTRASNLTDVSYKPTWDHCFKCCVDVVRHLHLRDTRRQFCPAQHWLTNRVSLPDIPHTASYRSLLGARASRRRAFMPTRWRTRAQLLAESVGSSTPPPQLSVYEKVRATLLQELPFVFSFTDRAEVFLRLVQEDRNIAQEHSAFNVGPYISLRVRRTHIYEDSFDKLSPDNEPNMRLSLKVQLLNPAGAVEAGVDGGGLFREFLSELLKSSFDPNRGFFLLTRENTLYPNPSAHLLHEDFQAHYYFIGRMLGKALYEKLLVEIPLAGFFLSKLLSRKGFSIEFHHLDSLDPELCRNLLYLKTYQGDHSELGLDFTILVAELGSNRVVELVPDGANIPVTADNKIEYIYRMADFKLNMQIAKQCYAFRKGLHDVVSAEWLQLFDWRELQTMISGSATPVDIADLKKNAKYSGEYSAKHKTIKLFWQVVEQFDEQQRRQLLKFVTSCSRPPLLGFKDLHPPFCIQPSGSDQRLPSAATCMNLLKLPEYRDPMTLKEKLLYSITSNAGFELS